MADGQLAAPPEVTSVPYPKETDYVKNGTVDYDAYDKAYDAWLEAWQEKLQTMVDPADVAHWFTSSIPVLLQGAGDENRVCSPLNVYICLLYTSRAACSGTCCTAGCCPPRRTGRRSAAPAARAPA